MSSHAAPETLARIAGLSTLPGAPKESVLVMIDPQREYQGRLRLTGIADAVGEGARLLAFARSAGIPVIHVWYIVEDGAPGLKLNAPLFQGVKDGNALVRGSWGAAPAEGLEPEKGDFVVEKMRMNAWEGTRLESLLKGLGRDTVIVSGAWTNMSVEHTARTGADKGYYMIVPEDGCSTMNADWHNASINFALQNVSTVTNCGAVTEALSGVPAAV